MRDWFGVVTPRGSRLGTSRRQRLLAAGVAFALLLAGFISGSHQAAVAHVRCAHGELTDAPEVVAGSSDAANLVAQPSSAPAGDHGHEHCVLATALHAVEQTRQVASASITIDRDVVATVIVTTVASRDPIYRTAPKTSPPA